MVRFKCRYLLVELVFPPDQAEIPFVNEGMLVTIMRDSLKVNFGDAGWAEVGGSLHGKLVLQKSH